MQATRKMHQWKRKARRWAGDRVDGEDVLEGMVAGLVGGLVATWTMTAFQRRVASPLEKKAAERSDGNGRASEDEGEPSEPATEQVAEALSETVAHHELSPSARKKAGQAVHYGYGTLAGGFYGGMAEALPEATVGAGAPFGAALWLLGDEVAVPALGLGQPPKKVPVRKHASALASHVVYGVTLDVVRRGLLKLWR